MKPDTSASFRVKLIIILGTLTAFGPLSIDMYLPAFSEIAKTFNTSLAQVQMSLASFFLGLALGQLLYGPASDRFGRKKPLYLGLLLYLAASLACAWAPSIETLIVARFFQALGSCAGLVIARAMVRDLFEAQESARMYSLLMLVMGVAPILAPIAGSAVVAHGVWRPIFLLMALVAALCLAAVKFFLPETKVPDRSVTWGRVLPSYGALLKHREFMAFALSGGAAYASMFAYITGSPFVFLKLYGIPQALYSRIFGANALGLIALSQLNARLLKRHALLKVYPRTSGVMLVLALALLSAGLSHAGFRIVVPLLFAQIAILGMVYPNATAAALRSQHAQAGRASALLGTVQFVLATLASALVSVFHNGTLLPMTGVMAGFVIASLLFYGLMGRTS